MSLLQLNDHIVWFKKEAFELLYQEAIEKFPLETGGVFIGYQLSKNETVITHVVGPGSNAEHFPERFIPDQKFHEGEISRYFIKTEATEVYLGDWHTHPKDDVYLSRLDKKTLRNIARFKESQIKNPIMGVFGNENENFCIWQYIPSKIRFLDFMVNVKECLIKFY